MTRLKSEREKPPFPVRNSAKWIAFVITLLGVPSLVIGYLAIVPDDESRDASVTVPLHATILGSGPGEEAAGTQVVREPGRVVLARVRYENTGTRRLRRVAVRADLSSGLAIVSDSVTSGGKRVLEEPFAPA